jgi:hypothetical protein
LLINVAAAKGLYAGQKPWQGMREYELMEEQGDDERPVYVRLSPKDIDAMRPQLLADRYEIDNEAPERPSRVEELEDELF